MLLLAHTLTFQITPRLESARAEEEEGNLRSKQTIVSRIHPLRPVLQFLLLQEVHGQVTHDALLMHASLEMTPRIQRCKPRLHHTPEVAVKLPAGRAWQLAKGCPDDGVLQ